MTLPLLFLAAALHYKLALPGYHYQFPRDHFSHPDYRTEWWYYTGNLRGRGGHRYGFELVFFRQGQDRGPAQNPSAWRVDDLYLAHLALTDIDAGGFRYTRRLNRAGPGIAGVSFDQGRIWNGNWQVRWDKTTDSQQLTATAEGIQFSLRLTPLIPAVINGENGVSRKAAGVGRASYYVSFPRMAVEGRLNGAEVGGTAWMDHEWFTESLDPSQQGWDWFSVQLENGANIMLFDLRDAGGAIDPYSSGTFIAKDGSATHLKRTDFHLEPLDYWSSPKTHARYPVKWRISIPAMNISLECVAAVKNQELVSEDTPGLTYWEGAVAYSGSSRGVGYLEMTGYSAPVKLY
ncbi:MAG TPA: lipocalin-like domain-containing protein [Bryobacteraceae bacterium]|nr:lipocalin-like domain-containing protein [Bryobacteraceae bacterium]